MDHGTREGAVSAPKPDRFLTGAARIAKVWTAHLAWQVPTGYTLAYAAVRSDAMCENSATINTVGRSTALASVRWPLVVAVTALFIGLALRGYVVVQPPSPPMLWDHHEYVRWGVLMHEEGLVALYDHPPHESLMCDRRHGGTGTARHPEHFIRRACNYPPLAGYVLYAQMKALHALDPSLASNTVAARVIYALLSILGDCMVAAGCLAIVRRFATPLAGAIAFAVIMLAPPFIIDSARWTQTDSWVLAPLVWMLWAMTTRRWLTAGVLWGVALGLKTQAILVVPVWAFALLLRPQRLRIAAAALPAVGILLVAALPFIWHSGWKWFTQSYSGNLLEMYKYTTLKAFNVWYVDLLICDNLDAGALLLGLQKDTWGKLMFAAALVASGVLIFRRRRAHLAPLVIFAAALLLAAVMLPTRVHERYIILPLPFLVIAAMWRRRLWIALVPLIAAATVQMMALDWLGRTRGAGSWPDLLAGTRSQRLADLTREYEQLRTVLSPEEFATLLPPEEQLERRCREAYRHHRADVVAGEWALTVAELLAAGTLFVLLLFSPRGADHRPPDPGVTIHEPVA